MTFEFVRVLRSPYSERFVIRSGDRDVAALDLHYLPTGRVDGTLIVFDNAGLGEAQIPELLARVDEVLLPGVSVAEHNLSFTVVIGKVLGAFVPDGKKG
jgi:hypothetical protein